MAGVAGRGVGRKPLRASALSERRVGRDFGGDPPEQDRSPAGASPPAGNHSMPSFFSR
jgi:hypothetical protein